MCAHTRSHQAHTHTLTHRCTHTCSYTGTHQVRTHTQAHTLTHRHTHMLAHRHTHVCTHTFTPGAHTHAHTHARTRAHTHMQSLHPHAEPAPAGLGQQASLARRCDSEPLPPSGGLSGPCKHRSLRRPAAVPRAGPQAGSELGPWALPISGAPRTQGGQVKARHLSGLERGQAPPGGPREP